jgi:hypothetical protein
MSNYDVKRIAFPAGKLNEAAHSLPAKDRSIGLRVPSELIYKSETLRETVVRYSFE